MPKNIVVCADGSPADNRSPTNVSKLLSLVVDRTPDQISFYTDPRPSGLLRLHGLVDIHRHVFSCYEFLQQNYEVGDRLFLFGFGSGAVIVRTLSALVDLVGILPRADPKLRRRAYRIFRLRNPTKRNAEADDLVRSLDTSQCRIHFIGVWETSQGPGSWFGEIFPLRHRFHDLRLSAAVENAYHALAIDDERFQLHPVLWDATITEDQSLEQVWFCGSRSDVGGGYREQQLSDISLEWMCGMAKKHGLHLMPDYGAGLSPEPDGLMHDPRATALQRIYYRRRDRKWPTKTHGPPMVHRSVIQRTLNRHNAPDPPYSPWILDGREILVSQGDRTNPYVVGSPVVSEKLFVGRANTIATILNGVHNNHYYLLGPRRSGKTSLLRRLSIELEQARHPGVRFHPVAVDFQAVSENMVFDAIRKKILEVVVSMPNLSKMLDSMDLLSPRIDLSDDLVDWFEDVYDALDSSDKERLIFVLLIDEFDKINEFALDIKEDFRTLFMRDETRDNLRLIATGGELEIWDRSSPLNFLIELDIGVLSREEARLLVQRPSRGQFEWDDQAVDYVVETSERKPYEIQKLCSSVVSYALQVGAFRIDQALLDAHFASQPGEGLA